MRFIIVFLHIYQFCYVYGQVAISCPTSYTIHPVYPNLCIYAASNSYSQWHHASCPNGGSLAQPYNRLIHDFVTTFLDTGETYYIGLNDSNGALLWRDGEVFSGRFDVIGNLTNVLNGCVYYYHTGQWEWDLSNCAVLKSYICEYIIPNIDPNIRLFNDTLEGRVEIYRYNRWGTVTHSNPPDTLGVVICKMLGYDFADYDVSSTVEDGTGPVWLDGVNCSTKPATIDECASLEDILWGPTIAPHTTDVKVRCTVSIASSSSFCLAATSTTTTTETMTSTTTSFTTETVTMTTKEMLQPTQCIQITTMNSQTYSPFTSTTAGTYSHGIMQSSAEYSSVQPPSSQPKLQQVPKYNRRTSAMYSTSTKQDNRPSAVAIGSLGVIILVGLLGSAFYLDLLTIGKERQVFRNAGKAPPRRQERTRRSPDGRESGGSMSTSGASSDITVNEMDENPSESNENSSNLDELQRVGSAQVHPIPHGVKPLGKFPLSFEFA
ncbi:soluble scavenger receptor cysteine-rich domain-containing protein SSC5D-like [Pecten maximus]|uniref:soluble scavenger receptor cysteine-rich domain-containing protein SSC5D-like n=1 Tax=Pecten maximus TaxID=6579 RepID=UPI001457E7DB|nr:soluble scavenger receptor cysteine-rich domain-containing protein SSC5D-like [Pecten maximus]